MELVPGDVVLLEAGDRISADLTVDRSMGLAVNESLLTGESVPRRLADGAAAYAGTYASSRAAPRARS
jgi:P-type E1-E2 ATPase